VVQGAAAAATFPQVIAIMHGSIPEEKRKVIFGAVRPRGGDAAPGVRRGSGSTRVRDICTDESGTCHRSARGSTSVRIDTMESSEEGLRPPRHLVSPRARVYWAVRALGGWLVPIAVEVVWMTQDEAHLGLHVAALVVTVILAAAHVTVMPLWRFRVHRWESTPEAVYTQSGWFNQERRIAPVSRIQTVDSERGPIEQLFRLSNVTVTTASAAGPIKIHGLDRDTAQRLVDELTEGTQAERGDAT
jgi:membrane protein YdbS with pleckstrin-like domain